MGYWDAIAPSLALLAIAIAILPWLNRSEPIVRTAVLAICLFLTWRYMVWRLFHTLPPITDHVDFTVGIIFTSLEALTLLGSSMSMIFLTRINNRSSEVDHNIAQLYKRDTYPLVDVLICTYNEEGGILERSIIGAISMQYPNYRVWVCDDGRRLWLRELCEKYDVGYLTRDGSEHAKAGNINAALRNLATLDATPEFISIFDADFVPLPNFLIRTMALMDRPEIAVVQTPQHFFNSDPIQSNLSLTKVFPDEQRYFYDIVMASKDAWGAAFCCGTSCVIRFSSLQSIGGFPTDSVTEDYLLSLRLRQIGYQTVYLNEALSLGLAPEGMAEYMGQRSRWCLGFMQICRGTSGPLWLNNNLSMTDRFVLIDSFLYWAASHAFRILAIIVPILYLLFNIQAVHANAIDAIDHALPFFSFQIVAYIWVSKGRIMPVISDLYQLLCSIDVLKSTVTGLTKPRGQKFKVTAKGGDRTKQIIQWPMLRFYILLIALTILGIANTFLLNPSGAVAESAGIVLFWSWYNLFVLLLACFVCVESPRYRSVDRFHTDELVTLEVDGEDYIFSGVDISVGGMQISGESPGSLGKKVKVRLSGLTLLAEIVRKSNAGFAVQFDEMENDRIAIVQRIFSGRYSSKIQNINATWVVRALTAKIFG